MYGDGSESAQQLETGLNEGAATFEGKLFGGPGENMGFGLTIFVCDDSGFRPASSDVV